RWLTDGPGSTATLWDPITDRVAGEPLNHDGNLTAVEFSRDGRSVVTVSADRYARVWNTKGGRSVTPPLRHDASVQFAHFAPDGRYVVTGSADGTARVWEVATGRLLGPPIPHPGGLRCAALGPGGRRVVTLGNAAATVDAFHARNVSAQVWDVATGTPLGQGLMHRG